MHFRSLRQPKDGFKAGHDHLNRFAFPFRVPLAALILMGYQEGYEAAGPLLCIDSNSLPYCYQRPVLSLPYGSGWRHLTT